jgi:error-prone DNA polymerase
MVIRGRLERSEGVINVVADHLAPLPMRAGVTSRDFR